MRSDGLVRTRSWMSAQRVTTILCVLVLLTCLTAVGSARTHNRPASPSVYFIAATPAQADTPRWYPAALYALGEKQKLRLVRQVFTAQQYFSGLADDLHGRIYLAAGKAISVIHEDDPEREDLVSLGGFDNFPCWGTVQGEDLASRVQFCYGPEIREVLGDAVPGKPRVGPGSWAKFKWMQYGGENGGPFQMQPPLAEIAGANLVMPYSIRPEVVLAQLPPELAASPAKGRNARIIASTDRYLAIWLTPEYMLGHTISTANPDHDEPLHVPVLYRATNKWKTLELPTAVSSITNPAIRIFGDWLVTTRMEWRPGPPGSGSGSPGKENERLADLDSGVPDIRDEYYNRFLNLYIPGRLLIQNLVDGRKLTLETGQEDSEVLAIRADGQILYRVNDSIYSARISDKQIEVSTLVVKDDNAPDVHWAFWGPAAKSGQPATSLKSLD